MLLMEYKINLTPKTQTKALGNNRWWSAGPQGLSMSIQRCYLMKLQHKTEESAQEPRQLERKWENVLTNQGSALTVAAVLLFAAAEFLLFPVHWLLLVLSKPIFVLVWAMILYSGQESNVLFNPSSGFGSEFSIATEVTQRQNKCNRSLALTYNTWHNANA